MKLPSGAPRVVLVLLLLIAILELGIAGKFSALWQLAFVGHFTTTPSEPGTPVHGPAAPTTPRRGQQPS